MFGCVFYFILNIVLEIRCFSWSSRVQGCTELRNSEESLQWLFLETRGPQTCSSAEQQAASPGKLVRNVDSWIRTLRVELRNLYLTSPLSDSGACWSLRSALDTLLNNLLLSKSIIFKPLVSQSNRLGVLKCWCTHELSGELVSQCPRSSFS